MSKCRTSPLARIQPLWLPAVIAALLGPLWISAPAWAQEGDPQEPAPQEPAPAGEAPKAAEPPAEGDSKPVLADGEFKKLTKAFQSYFQAAQKREGTLEALDEIEKVTEAIEKKLKGRRTVELIADLERAMIAADERSDNVEKGKIALNSFTGAWGDTIRYAVHAPKSYRVKSGPYPLLLVIPEQGKAPEVALREQWTEPGMMEQAIVAVVGMPGNVADWASIGSRGQAGGVASAMQVIRQVSRAYSIDPNRVLIAGHARGAQTAIEIASLYPHVFAAAIARAGDLGATPATNFANLAVLLAGAGGNASQFEGQARELGDKTVTVSPDPQLPAIWAWAKDQRRTAHPTRVRFSPGKPEAMDAYWLNVEGFAADGKSQLSAEIDRSNNLVRITGEGFSHVRLMLNDRLLDLSKPVRVVINGTEQESKFAPNLRAMLDRAALVGDRGRAYTASWRMEFTAPSKASE
jgi:poly(3-hydroxybutyrate) depolymerase